MNREIIFIDDELHVRESITQTLTLEGFTVHSFSHAKEALSIITPLYQGIIISDINMPMMDGITFLQQALAIDSDLQVIMLTGHGDISMAVKAMSIGAYHFIEKPFSTDRFIDIINKAFDRRNLILENKELKNELAAQSAPGPRILGNSEEIKQVRRILHHVKNNTDSVLISGDSGTGKKLLARYIHDHSQNSSMPFIRINCRHLISSSEGSNLFEFNQDHQLTHPRLEKLHQLQTGTLYLHDIDKMASKEQTSLLHYLQLAPTLSEFNIRIIASSSLDLLQASRSNRFNSKLLYALNSISISLPPLSNRKKDIPLLFQNFTRTAASRYGIETPAISADLFQQLKEYDWPGNVRELRNFAEKSILMGTEVALSTLMGTTSEGRNLGLMARIDQFEFTLISDALQRHNGRLKEVQDELQLARKTLYDKMKKHHLDKDNFKG
ncbi:sigma-54-dependent transcriptional regulator [Aliivibrio kagoshimensis]|uniref:sigma-54-dependent transcriptional regulator n=1 Tax=Aliivibrio kagoshimensis TaxID=2910230 RepID=UPI003D1056ED